MPTLDEVGPAKAKAEARLLKLPGVTGVGVGYKRVGGKKTDTLAIIVYVECKRDVASEHAIPKEIEGTPTDVVERRFVLHGEEAAGQGGSERS